MSASASAASNQAAIGKEVMALSKSSISDHEAQQALIHAGQPKDSRLTLLHGKLLDPGQPLSTPHSSRRLAYLLRSSFDIWYEVVGLSDYRARADLGPRAPALYHAAHAAYLPINTRIANFGSLRHLGDAQSCDMSCTGD